MPRARDAWSPDVAWRVFVSEGACVMRVDSESDKGWYLGPWNSQLEVSVGYARRPPDEPHLHRSVHELYLVARGTCRVRVEGRTLELSAGELLHLRPGEAHTFLACSNDYFHYVIHTPGLAEMDTRDDKQVVPRNRLGLTDQLAHVDADSENSCQALGRECGRESRQQHSPNEKAARMNTTIPHIGAT